MNETINHSKCIWLLCTLKVTQQSSTSFLCPIASINNIHFTGLTDTSHFIYIVNLICFYHFLPGQGMCKTAGNSSQKYFMAHNVILTECQLVVLFVAPCWLGIQNITSVTGLFSFSFQTKDIHIPPYKMECALFLSIDALQVYCTLLLL